MVLFDPDSDPDSDSDPDYFFTNNGLDDANLWVFGFLGRYRIAILFYCDKLDMLPACNMLTQNFTKSGKR